MIHSTIIPKQCEDDYVYDISLDSTFVNALGFNVLKNTDGFNFKIPDKLRYTEENPYIGKGLNRIVKEGAEYVGYDADIAEFNDLYMREKMGLSIDEVIPGNILIARKNYLDLLDDGSVKLVGNTIKSKKLPKYIEKFIDKSAELLLNNRGAEFLEFYYDYIEKIYNMQIPLKDIATVGKIKTTIKQYQESCKQFTAAGSKKSRQAWYELAIKENLSVNMGDAIYYINVGTKKTESDVQRVTNYYYIDSKGKQIDYVVDENGEPIYDKKGNKKTLTKFINSEFTKYKKNNKETYKKDFPNTLSFGRSLFPKLQERDDIIFNCVYLPNNIVEDEEDHFCDDTFEYNREKYISMLNKRIRPLLVVFDKSIRFRTDEKGKLVDNILISNPKDRKTFTEEESRLVSGQPYKNTDQDSYEQLMTMDDKEIGFWIKRDKKPAYIDFIEGMDWDKIKTDYLERQKQLLAIQDEIDLYNSLINEITSSDKDSFIDDETLPPKIAKLVDKDENTGDFISKKYNIKIGSMYDIIDKVVPTEDEFNSEQID